MATKHTPGPLFVEYRDTTDAVVVVDSQGNEVAQVFANDNTPEARAEQLADATIFAQAPALLGAAKDLLTALPWVHTPACQAQVGTDRYDPEGCDGCSVSRLRAAIAAAEGK